MSQGATRLIKPTTAIVIDVVITPIMAVRNLSQYDTIMFHFLNDDTVNTYTVTIETGETSDAIDAEWAPSVVVPAKVNGIAGQRTITVGPDHLRSFFRVSGIATGTAVNARWGAKGIPRLAPVLP